MDLTYLIELSDGDDVFIRDILETYLEENPKDIALLQEACQTQASTSLQKTAHKIKSSFKLLGLSDLYQLALQLEKSALDRLNDWKICQNEVAALVKGTEQSYQDIRTYLENQA